jgi:ABC-2 type transport system permease protein
VQALPTTMATYRERGILRRLSTTPVHPASLLVADLLVYLVATLVAVALLVLVGWAVFDIPLPQHVLGFAVALLLGTAALFALGLVIAAVVPSARAATVVGIVVFLAVLFLGGVYLPSEVMPEAIARIGVYTPPGAQALQDAWLGTGPSVLHLIVMAAIAVTLCVVAALVFRWE